MTDKPEKTLLPSGEDAVDAIRNIIFGEQEKYFQQKLETIEKKLEALKNDYQGKIDQLTRTILTKEKNLKNRRLIFPIHSATPGKTWSTFSSSGILPPWKNLTRW